MWSRQISHFERFLELQCRVVSLGDSDAFSPDGIGAIFKPAWEKISVGEAVVCAETGSLFDALPVPEASIVDVGISKQVLEHP